MLIFWSFSYRFFLSFFLFHFDAVVCLDQRMNFFNQNVKIFQWNSRSIFTNLLAFENHISQGNYCILALQSLNVEKRNLPRMNNYYYPLLCNSNMKTKKVQPAIYICSDPVYTIPISSPVTNAMEEVYATTAMVKINEQQRLMSSPYTFQIIYAICS